MCRTSLALMLAAGIALGAPAAAAHDGEVNVAVAANFLSTSRALARRFMADHQARVLISSGSTGKLYAQIRHGAPYDLFLAADVRRPRKLEQAGLIVRDSRFTYAVGRLVLWSRDPRQVDTDGRNLKHGRIARLAIANPKTAPYGAAARTALQRLGLWSRYRQDLVRGENVGQTFQFAVTGNVDAAFVALSQISDPHHPQGGSRWIVPERLYPRIEQQAVLLKNAAANPAAADFANFLHSAAARAIIERYGYGVPALRDRQAQRRQPTP
ncbi:MAG: molybdate ABC transporter substrate-binding protein [Gammaproteobacteria bacterium]